MLSLGSEQWSINSNQSLCGSDRVSLGQGQALCNLTQASSPSQHNKGSRVNGKGKGKAHGSNIPRLKKKKKQNAKIWHKFRQKRKLGTPLLGLPNEVLDIIFKHCFTGVHLTDIKTTQPATTQRRSGAQSVLFVCKELREVATEAMFKYAIFDIPHFKLHKKHRRENKMTTLHKVQHLDLLWTPPPSASFTTKRGDDEYVLQEIDHLRSLHVWLLASQHLRLENIVRPEFMSRVERQEAMLAKFAPSVKSQPRWLKRLLRDAPKNFHGVEISLVGFFAFGPRLGADLTAAHISWPSRSISCTEKIKWADWERARAGLTCKHLRRPFAYVSSWHPPDPPFTSPVGRLAYARGVMRPGVGDRSFGRKVW